MPVDFTQLLRTGGSIGDSYREGQQIARQDAEERRKIAAQQQAASDQKTARSGIAAALATGDLRKAASVAYLYGDDKSGTGLATLAKDGYDRAGKNNTSLANLVSEVAKVPYGERRAVIQTLRPFLETQGMNGHDIDGFDPTDENIAALSHIDYNYGQSVKDGIDQRGADTAKFSADTSRITAEQPVVVGGSLVTRGGKELFRAPNYINAPVGNNVYEVSGTTAQGYESRIKYTPGSVSAEQLYRAAIEPQESGGRAGVIGPQTRYGRAEGASQMLPATAQSMAQKLGIQYRPDLMRATTPEGLAYQRKLGIAYTQTALDANGGDPRAAAEFYHGGPDKSIHGPKTRAYGDQVIARLDRVIGQQNTTRQPRLIQRGVPNPRSGNTVRDQQQGQRAIDSTDQAIRSARELLTHPGLNAAVGSAFDPASYGKINPFTGQPFAGTNAANFHARLDTLKAQTFLPQVQALRGLGALSDAEGKKLTDAVGALSVNMSEDEFKQSLAVVISDLTLAKTRASQIVARGGATSQSSAPIAAQDLLRQNPALRDAFEAKYGAGSAAQVLGQ